MWLQTGRKGLLHTGNMRHIYRLNDKEVWANLGPEYDVEICVCDTAAQAEALIDSIRDMIMRGVTVAIVDGDNTLFEYRTTFEYGNE